MTRYKKAKGAGKQAPTVPHAGLPCLVLVIAAVIFTMALMYFALKSSGT
jgi:hypothetical protein